MKRKILGEPPPPGTRFIPCHNLATALQYAESSDENDPWEWSSERPGMFQAFHYVVEHATN